MLPLLESAVMLRSILFEPAVALIIGADATSKGTTEELAVDQAPTPNALVARTLN